MLISRWAAAQHEGLAESLFREARQDMKRGQPSLACPKFAESYRLDPSIGTLLNWGLCEQGLGHTVTAWTKLCQFLDEAPTDDTRVAIAKHKIAELEPVLPRLRIILAKNDADSTVALDGVVLGRASLGLTIPVDPGEHTLTLTAATGERKQTEVQLRPGETVDVALTLPEPAPKVALLPPAQSPPEPQRKTPGSAQTLAADRSTERTVAYVIGAAGIVGLGTAAVFGGMAMHDKNVVAEHCPNHVCETPEGADAVRSGARNETAANIAFVAGAALLATGGVVLWHSTKGRAVVSAGPSVASLSWVGVWR